MTQDTKTDDSLERTLRHFFLHWYEQCGRTFPWRNPKTTPFEVLIAEMLLRQTNAEKVAPIWVEFLKRFSVPAACTSASESELRDVVGILGLGHQRARAIKAVASTLVDTYSGEVPASIDELKALPHIGLYTSHAVACFAFGQRYPVVDVNVMRVLSRIAGWPPATDNRRAQELWELAWRILPSNRVQEHNYGLLDFSAQVCKPRRPECAQCPLNARCVTGAELLGLSVGEQIRSIDAVTGPTSKASQ